MSLGDDVLRYLGMMGIFDLFAGLCWMSKATPT